MVSGYDTTFAVTADRACVSKKKCKAGSCIKQIIPFRVHAAFVAKIHIIS